MLVVGTADRDDLDDVARAAQDRLGRPVNIRRITPAGWAEPDPGNAFLTSVRQRPLIELPLDSSGQDPTA
ncbi:MAG: hypothetical protein ACYCPF_03720 [Streptosporangiaceae bacterium]